MVDVMAGVLNVLLGQNSGAASASISFTASAVSASDLTTYTFASQSLGSAATGRKIIVGVGGSQTSGVAISSVTVAGVPATSIATNVAASGAFNRSALYIADVPTGTTGDVVVTFASGVLRAGVGVWAAYNLNSSTATSTGTSLSNPYSSSLTVNAGGIAVCYAFTYFASGLPTHSYSGLTKDFDQDMESSVLPQSGGSANFA